MGFDGFNLFWSCFLKRRRNQSTDCRPLLFLKFCKGWCYCQIQYMITLVTSEIIRGSTPRIHFESGQSRKFVKPRDRIINRWSVSLRRVLNHPSSRNLMIKCQRVHWNFRRLPIREKWYTSNAISSLSILNLRNHFDLLWITHRVFWQTEYFFHQRHL